MSSADVPAPGSHQPPLRALVADDEATIRLLLSTVLRHDDRFEVVGEAVDGHEAITLSGELQPDVVLLDLLMPGMGGREALPAIRAASPRSMVVVLSALSAVDEAKASLEMGAFAYFEKSMMGPELPAELADYHGRFRRELAGENVWDPADPRRMRR